MVHTRFPLAKSMENGWHVDGLLTDKDDIKAACDACKDEASKR